ncbi:hypothetical protein HDV05_007594 [Chytridiales sp. JEL 0842]|nr:hypothetical protein HDV05_007594 [Chytridiales sp. JEL 0842]
MIYFLLGMFICVYGLVSLGIKERLYMSEAMVATIFGVIIGPLAGKQLLPSQIFGMSIERVTLEFSRIIIAIQCMACGIDLPGNYLWREKLSIAILLGPVTIAMWLTSALGVYLIIGTSFLDAMIIAACMAPTDPILANSIMKGKFAEAHIPLNVRLVLTAESGANDGFGTPLLLLGVYLQRISSPGQAVGEWTYKVLLYQIGVCIVLSAFIAYLARLALKAAERNNLIDKESLLSFSVALSLVVMGAMSLMGANDLLAAFVAGNVLTWDLWFNQHIRESHFQEVIDNLLNLSYFIFIGAIIPWSDYGSTDQLAVWRLVLLALWVLILRRAPVVMALYYWIPALKSPKEAFFAGWFGPIGAGAIYYARFATVVVGLTSAPVFPIVTFIVLSSVLVHGASVPFFNLSLQRASTYQTWAAGELVRSATLSDRITNFFAGFYTPAEPQPRNPFENGRPEITIVKLPEVKLHETPFPDRQSQDTKDSEDGVDEASQTTGSIANAWDGKNIQFVETSRDTLLQEPSGFITSIGNGGLGPGSVRGSMGMRPASMRGSVIGPSPDFIESGPLEGILVGSVTNNATRRRETPDVVDFEGANMNRSSCSSK